MAESIERWFDIAEGYLCVPLKGTPDLKEEDEGYVREGAGLWEEAEGNPKSQQGEKDGRKKEREKRAYPDNTSALRE